MASKSIFFGSVSYNANLVEVILTKHLRQLRGVQVPSNSSYQRLADLLLGAKIALSLRALAKNNIADKLAAGPMPVEALANETGLAVEPLRRVLRAVSQYGVFNEREDGQFENSEMSSHMRSDVSGTLRETILFLNHDVSLRAWLELDETLKDGKCRFAAVNGAPLFELFARDRDLSEYFGKCMANLYGPQAAKIASGYPFGQYSQLMDVGGGQGHILAAILSTHETVHGTLFDIAPTAALARRFLGRCSLANRYEVLDGDFFVAVPPGYDAYLLKSVVHDFDDNDAVKILRNCRKAIQRDGTLLIIEEIVVPRQTMGNTHKLVDLDLLVHFGGKERTVGEYERLLNDADFRLEQIAPVKDSFFSVIEATPN